MNEHTDATEGLKTVVERAADRLRRGEVPNERTVDNAVVQPILNALGWDKLNIHETYAEYAVGSRRVDWALLKNDEPWVLLEEKAPDQKLSDHEKQLLDYAFEQGVRLAVLTNGKEWWFYLPLEAALWPDRKFLMINLMTGELRRICVDLKKFLGKDLVHRGFSYKKAKELYDEAREEDRIKKELPPAICELLLSPSPEVIEFFQNQTQGVIGALSPGELVEDALKAVFATKPPVGEAQADQTGGTGKKRRKARSDLPPPYARLVGLAIDGEAMSFSKWKDILVQTGNWLIYKGYAEQLPYEVICGTKKILVSKSKRVLTAPKQLTNGSYIETNYNCGACVKNARWLLMQVGLAEDNLQVEWEEPA